MLHTSVSTRRSGMVLLIVMVLLSMVGLTAVTFLLTTGQLKEAANQNRRMGEITVDPEAMLQDGIMTIIRGTENSDSAVYQNSILEDMYGYQAQYADPSAEFTGNWGTENGMITISGGQSDYAGCVITCVDEESPAYGRSTVVLKYQNGKMYCLPFPDGATFDKSAKFIVNSLPYQQPNHDYDALDDNNKYLAGRNPDGSFSKLSFCNSETDSSVAEVDADNDGYKDSKWLDLGMPVFTNKDGTRFKPLFGVVIEDMDGKVNVNTTGPNNDNPDAMGRGPAEVKLLNTDFSNLATTLYNSRFGSTGSPLATEQEKGPAYKDYDSNVTVNNETNVNILRTPHDWLGRYSREVNNTSVLPVYSSNSSSINNRNTYDIDLGYNHLAGNLLKEFTATTNKDMPFSPAELEAILRPYDFDSPFLPQRLKKILDDAVSDNSQMRGLFTTESWDLPMIRNPFNDINAIREAVLPEFAACGQIDLMRAATFNFKEDKWDGTKFPKRQKFMMTVYKILEKLNIDPGGTHAELSFRQAQWAANLVDFIDVDNVMTPFCFKGENNKQFTVFGCEQPEILISGTFAMHSRNTEEDAILPQNGDDSGLYIGGSAYEIGSDSKIAKGPKSETDDTVYEIYEKPFKKENYPVGKDKDGNDIYVTDATEASINAKMNSMGAAHQPDGEWDWDQYVRPQGALFVQLYNPMPGSEQPIIANDIYKEGTRDIEITKSVGKNPVWRLVVTDNYTDNSNGGNNIQRDSATWAQTGGSGDCFTHHVKIVASFCPGSGDNAAPDLGHDSEQKYFVFYPEGGGDLELSPGQTMLIGPSGQTVFKFNENNDNGTVTAVDSITMNNNAFNGNYGTGKGLAMRAYTDTANPEKSYARFSLTEPRLNYASGDYYGPEGNDFLLHANELSTDTPLEIPVDSTWGLFKKAPNLKHFGTEKDNRCLVHLQRLADPNREYNVNNNPYITVDSMVVDLTVMNARTTKTEKDKNGANVTTGANQPALCMQCKKGQSTLWEQNSKNDAAVSSENLAFGTFNGPENAGWLGWINTVPTSPYQLMNVTNRCPSDLLYFYDPNDTSTFGYLPDFDSEHTKLGKIIGFFKVPSPQTVTPMVLNRGKINHTDTTDDGFPFVYYSMYREPGKINVNTISDKRVLEALIGKSITDAQWSDFKNYTYHLTNTQATDSFKTVWDLANMFNTNSSVSCDPTSRFNMYRVGNLATTRSNVFAVWLTMGFFEVDASDKVTGVELGSDSGERKRYRAFYMIDRTIPVGFERGKNHNADKVIILRRMLQ